MNLFISEANLQACSCSMRCIEPDKDATYDIQLSPMKNQASNIKDASDVRWGVFVQYARNGEKEKWSTKTANTSWYEALSEYNDARQKRFEHNYYDEPLTRHSDLTAMKEEAATQCFVDLKAAPVYVEAVTSASQFVTQTLEHPTLYGVNVLAAFSDLALGLPEGNYQVPELCAAYAFDGQKLAQRLSKEMYVWLEHRVADMGELAGGVTTLCQALLNATSRRGALV